MVLSYWERVARESSPFFLVLPRSFSVGYIITRILYLVAADAKFRGKS